MRGKVIKESYSRVVRLLTRYWITASVLAVAGLAGLLSSSNTVRAAFHSLSGSGLHVGHHIWRLPDSLTIALLTAIGLTLGLILYLFIDYRAHRKPLQEADPHVHYNLVHHVRVVSLPLLKYDRWLVSKSIGLGALLMATFVTTAMVAGISSGTINTISVTINKKANTSITAPVFTVVFSEPINPASFTAEDVNLTGNAINPRVTAITQVAPDDGTTFEVTIGADASGTVTATIPAANVSYAATGFAQTGDTPNETVADSLGNSFLATNTGIEKLASDGSYTTFAQISSTQGLAL